MNNATVASNTSSTGDGEWGHLAEFAEFAAAEHRNSYKKMDLDEALKYTTLSHAAHCMIYAPWNDRLFDLYNPRAAILMQLRFDGYVGFPGGLVDEGETPVEAAIREMKEELNFDTDKHRLTLDHHIVSHVNHEMKLVTHFFALPIPYDDFVAAEKCGLTSDDYGKEVLGILRPPLYTMGDHYRGFPAFLDQNFIGNAKDQLIESLKKCNILTEDEINAALIKSLIQK